VVASVEGEERDRCENMSIWIDTPLRSELLLRVRAEQAHRRWLLAVPFIFVLMGLCWCWFDHNYCYNGLQVKPSPWWMHGWGLLMPFDLLREGREWLLDVWERPLPWKQWK